MTDPGTDACNGTNKSLAAFTSLGYQLCPVESTIAPGDFTGGFSSCVGEVQALSSLLVFDYTGQQYFWSACSDAGIVYIPVGFPPDSIRNAVTLLMPPGTTAFSFELLPFTPSTPYTVTATYSDGSTSVASSQVVTNTPEGGGAKLFGAYADGTATLATVDIVVGTALDNQTEFLLARMQISNTQGVCRPPSPPSPPSPPPSPPPNNCLNALRGIGDAVTPEQGECNGTQKNLTFITRLGYELCPVENTNTAVGGTTSSFASCVGPVTTSASVSVVSISNASPPITWACGYTGLVYLAAETPLGALTLRLPPGTTAFSFELLPYPESISFGVSATFIDGEPGCTTCGSASVFQQVINNSPSSLPGAKLFGAYADGTATIKTIDILMGALPGDQPSSFYIGQMQISSTLTCFPP